MEDKEIEGRTLELSCEGCGRWIDSPVFTTENQRHYCCEDCFLGKGCSCPDLGESARERRVLQPEWIALAKGQ
jgi:hypothetical protein